MHLRYACCAIVSKPLTCRVILSIQSVRNAIKTTKPRRMPNEWAVLMPKSKPNNLNGRCHCCVHVKTVECSCRNAQILSIRAVLSIQKGSPSTSIGKYEKKLIINCQFHSINPNQFSSLSLACRKKSFFFLISISKERERERERRMENIVLTQVNLESSIDTHTFTHEKSISGWVSDSSCRMSVHNNCFMCRLKREFAFHLRFPSDEK